MNTDDYSLVIDAHALCASARAACDCARCGDEQRRACARNAVCRDVCVCLLSAPGIMQALEADFCAHLGH